MAKETVVVVVVVVGLIIGIGMADAIGVARFRGKLGRSKFSVLVSNAKIVITGLILFKAANCKKVRKQIVQRLVSAAAGGTAQHRGGPGFESGFW